MQPSEALKAYARALKTAVSGKDPRGLRIPPCAMVLSFPDDGQLTIHIGTRQVEIAAGDARDATVPSVLLRVSLATWAEISRGTQTLAEAPLEIFGDPRILPLIGQLVVEKRSAVSARMFR